MKGFWRKVRAGSPGRVEPTASSVYPDMNSTASPGRVFTRSQLLDAVWGYGHDGYEHTVNSHINRLRAKIEDSPTEPGPTAAATARAVAPPSATVAPASLPGKLTDSRSHQSPHRRTPGRARGLIWE